MNEISLVMLRKLEREIKDSKVADIHQTAIILSNTSYKLLLKTVSSAIKRAERGES